MHPEVLETELICAWPKHLLETLWQCRLGSLMHGRPVPHLEVNMLSSRAPA